MSDAELLLLVETRKKSGIIAALLNLFVPGAGYMYCGRWFLGIIVLLLGIVVAFLAFASTLLLGVELFAGGFMLIVVIDGFLCADRYNKRLIRDVLDERASRRGFADQPVIDVTPRLIQHDVPRFAVDGPSEPTMPEMGERELHITCRKCGRIRIMRPDEVLPFEHHRLRCSHCGERDPMVTEHERQVPFTAGYRPR